jgi:hypothetical protein
MKHNAVNSIVKRVLAEGGGFGHRFCCAARRPQLLRLRSVRYSNPSTHSSDFRQANACRKSLAEGGGFEPPCHLRDAWFSRPARYDHFGIPPQAHRSKVAISIGLYSEVKNLPIFG